MTHRYFTSVQGCTQGATGFKPSGRLFKHLHIRPRIISSNLLLLLSIILCSISIVMLKNINKIVFKTMFEVENVIEYLLQKIICCVYDLKLYNVCTIHLIHFNF